MEEKQDRVDAGRDAENRGEVPEEEGGSRGLRREWGVSGVKIPLLSRREGGPVEALSSAGVRGQMGSECRSTEGSRERGGRREGRRWSLPLCTQGETR